MFNNQTDCQPLHPEVVNDIISKMISFDKIIDLSDFFKVMGDSTRLKILITLVHGECCVNDIACIANISQSAVSHQLKILRTSKLIKSRRKGRQVYYSLDDEHVQTILSTAIEHVSENE